jgi:hypothetical protein
MMNFFDETGPSEYGWIITKDHLFRQFEAADVDRTGTIGPRNITDEMTEQLVNGEGNRFRMYDDDGNLYYEGRYLGDLEYGDPVIDFGGPDAGCTYMSEPTGKNGAWEVTIG